MTMPPTFSIKSTGMRNERDSRDRAFWRKRPRRRWLPSSRPGRTAVMSARFDHLDDEVSSNKSSAPENFRLEVTGWILKTAAPRAGGTGCSCTDLDGSGAVAHGNESWAVPATLLTQTQIALLPDQQHSRTGLAHTLPWGACPGCSPAPMIISVLRHGHVDHDRWLNDADRRLACQCSPASTTMLSTGWMGSTLELAKAHASHPQSSVEPPGHVGSRRFFSTTKSSR